MPDADSKRTNAGGPLVRSRIGRIRRPILKLAGWIILFVLSLWAFGALWYDFPFFSHWVAAFFAIALLAGVLVPRQTRTKALMVGGGIVLVAVWWFTLQPSQYRRWQPDVAELAWAEVNGDEVVLHNIRNFAYRTEKDFTPRWETRTLRLSQLTGVDLFINYWGSPWMAHPIASFQFADAPPVCFSIETRKEEGESYSAIGGLYRQYELICLAAEESDVIRLRTNYRKGEESYLYRLRITPGRSRERFMDYIHMINSLRSRPRWYNALSANCTTAVRAQHSAEKRLPWDWRIIVNGKGDELLYERNLLSTGGLSFPELKHSALINPVAQAADRSPDFPRIIRQNRPGLEPVIHPATRE